MKEKLLNNWQLKLGTLIVAFIFWRMIGEVADPIITRTYDNVSVTMLNEEIVTDKGKVYQIENSDYTVSVVIKAKTSVLRNVTSSDITATADFEELELSELVPVRISISGTADKDFEAIVSPVNLIVVIEDSVSKKFPIVPSSIGTMTEGYDLGTLEVTPETVTISGPESIVNSIARVEAQVNITSVTEDAILSATLICYDDNNLMIDQTLLTFNLGEQDEVTVDVQVLDTKTVNLSLDYSGEPESGYQVVSVMIEPTSIVVAATQDILNELNVIEIPSSALDITGESGKVDRVIDVSLYLPDGVQLYDANSNSIAVTVQIDKLGTKSLEFPVQSIVVNNNPSDLGLSYNGVTEIMVTFTAIEDIIEDLEASDVQLSIDLKNYNKAGEYEVDVTVTTDLGYEVVEAVTVPIILTEN